MLRFRNTYKNCKVMTLYFVLICISMVIAFLSIEWAILLDTPNVFVYLIIAFSIFCTIFFYFLLWLKNNGYQMKYFFSGRKFKLLVAEKIKTLNPNEKANLKNLISEYKDCYRQYGVIELFTLNTTPYDNWCQKQQEFVHTIATSNRHKFDYIMYNIFEGCKEGVGLSTLFQNVLSNGFTKEELSILIFHDDILSTNFCDYLISNMGYIDKLNKAQKDNKKLETIYQKIRDEQPKLYYFEPEIYTVIGYLTGMMDLERLRYIRDFGNAKYTKDGYSRGYVFYYEELEIYLPLFQGFCYGFWEENSSLSRHFKTKEEAEKELDKLIDTKNNLIDKNNKK